jgi:hypothetical protein
MPTRHSVYGGSNASMWLNCPGGVALRAITPRRPTSRAAEEGTAQHEIMDMLLKDPDLQPEKFLGSTVLGIVITKEHIANVKIALEAYLEIEDSFPKATLIQSEREVELNEEAFGTADGIIVEGERAALFDFKFGQGAVDADAEQMWVYAVYAMKSVPQFAKVQQVELYIIQPAFDPAIDKIVVPRQALETFEQTIYAAIKVSKSPNPPFVEGEHCGWCHAKLACPAKLQRMPTLTAPNHVLDLDELSKMLAKFEEWKDWIKEGKERLQLEIEQGGRKDELWLLTPKRATRHWKNEAEAILAFKEAGVAEDDYAPRTIVTPAVAEKGLLPKPQVGKLAVPISSGNNIALRSSGKKEVLSMAALAENLKKLA